MKALTETHKKWILTAGLASLLSFNLVMSLAEPALSSADLASSTPLTGTINTASGPQKAEFYSYNGGKKTRMVITEGKDASECKDCSERILAVPFDPKAMNTILFEAQKSLLTDEDAAPAAEKTAKSSAKTMAEVAAADKDDDKDQLDESDSSSSPELKKLSKRCDLEKDEDVRTSCYGKGLAKLLNKDSKISELAAIGTWEDQVKEGMIRGLTSKNPTVKALAVELMGKMINNVDKKKYDTFRKTVLLAATESVANSYAEAQRFALKNKANMQLPAYRAEYVKRINIADSLRQELNASLEAKMTSPLDAKILDKGYVWPTAAIDEAMKARVYYKPLPEITADVYSSGYSLTGDVDALPGTTATKNPTAVQGRVLNMKDGTHVMPRSSGLNSSMTGAGAPVITEGAREIPATWTAKGPATVPAPNQIGIPVRH